MISLNQQQNESHIQNMITIRGAIIIKVSITTLSALGGIEFVYIQSPSSWAIMSELSKCFYFPVNKKSLGLENTTDYSICMPNDNICKELDFQRHALFTFFKSVTYLGVFKG